MTFKYTHGENDVESSAVFEAYFNDKTNELAVVLSSGHGYVYSNVGLAVYKELTTGRSAGRYYAKTVKREYGPGKSLGYVGFDNEARFVELVEPTPLAVGTPKGLTYASNANVSDERIELAVAVPAPSEVQYKHSVKFTVDGLVGVKTYNLNTTSVDAAIDALSEATAALGLNTNVKEVTVYFE